MFSSSFLKLMKCICLIFLTQIWWKKCIENFGGKNVLKKIVQKKEQKKTRRNYILFKIKLISFIIIIEKRRYT